VALPLKRIKHRDDSTAASETAARQKKGRQAEKANTMKAITKAESGNLHDAERYFSRVFIKGNQKPGAPLHSCQKSTHACVVFHFRALTGHF